MLGIADILDIPGYERSDGPQTPERGRDGPTLLVYRHILLVSAPNVSLLHRPAPRHAPSTVSRTLEQGRLMLTFLDKTVNNG